MKRIVTLAAAAAILALPAVPRAQTAQDLASINDLISRLPAAQVTALGKARAAYNAALPDQYDAAGKVISPKPGLLNDNANYWWFVWSQANQSYVVQYP